MKRSVFPILLLLVLGGASLSLHLELAPGLIPPVATALVMLLVMLAERRWPRVSQVAETHETRADASYAVLSTVVDAASTAALATLAVLLSGLLPPMGMSEVSLALAVPAALLVGGFGDYWAHRLSHETSWWWKLHAVHHAPHRMVAFNNLRLHPADLVLKTTASLLPVLLLGFSPEALAIVGALKGLNIAFQHANLDLRHGWLNYIVATNSVHRWHHSAKPSEGNANYGGVLVLYDLLFGTYSVPAESAEPSRMGLFGDEGYPVHNVRRAVVAPLCWKRCTDEVGG